MADDPAIEALRREVDAAVIAAASSLSDAVRQAVRQGETDLRDVIVSALAEAARAAVSELIDGASVSTGAPIGGQASGGAAELGQALASLAMRGRRFT